MAQEFEVACGGLDLPSKPALSLNLWAKGKEANVLLKIEDLHRSLLQVVQPEFLDLMEIATYVYVADQAFPRTNLDVDTFGANWRRTFRLHIPVRAPGFWQQPEVTGRLVQLLNFLSDDFFEFTFHPGSKPPELETYLGLGTDSLTSAPPQQVILFSGGLDSLAGAVDEAVHQKRQVVLVTHKPTPKNNSFLRPLETMLAERATPFKPLQVGVRANKKKQLGREGTQRTRSFLFAAFGFTVARMLGLKDLRFYENGILSLNLPICAQVVGGRATRTTHPKVIKGFENLFSLVAGERFGVENPYLWATKGDVIRKIVDYGCADMIKESCSCADTRGRTIEHSHCGTCSQCVDRRFATIAAAATEHDPINRYRLDIFTQSHPNQRDRIMLASYIQRAEAVDRIPDTGTFLTKFPMVVRAIEDIPGNRMAVAERLFQLYKRHAAEVNSAITTMARIYAEEIWRKRLPTDCLLRAVVDSRATQSFETIASPALPPLPDNAVLWVGDHWDVRFRGKALGTFKKSDGIAYMAFLLNSPGTEFSHLQLYRMLKPEEDPREADRFFSSESAKGFAAVDDKTLAAVRTRFSEIRQEKEDARAAGDFDRLEALEEEEAGIKKYRNLVKRKSGGSRIVLSVDDAARGAVLQAIRRARERIKARSAALHEHLAMIGPDKDTPGVLVYRPTEKVLWTIELPPKKDAVTRDVTTVT